MKKKKNLVLRKLAVLAAMLAIALAVAAPALAQGATGTVSGTLSANQQEEGPVTATDPSDKATLSFELTAEGEPPAGATFLGFTTLESVMTTPLTDPDGDGIYTGSMTVPKFAPGGPPEPISLSTVRIVQGPPIGYTANGPEYRVIKDFGSVKLDGDKTFSASVSFPDDGGPGGQEVSATGMIEKTESTSYQYGTHTINDSSSGSPIYALESEAVDLDDYDGSVTIYGKLVAGYEDGLDGGPPLVEVSRVETTTPPDGETYGVRGTITNISDSVVLVEEDPSAEGSGEKGYFSVTGETEITKQEEDGKQVEAKFEDLEVGQQVEAVYEGAVAQSYPTQGNAESILILEEADNTETSAMLSFELEVEGEPPVNAMFSGFIPAEGGISASLTDPDGDGLYTGSVEVERFGPGPRPVPPGTEPVSLPVQIVQATGVIKDFGLVKIDGDKTFFASVSFEGDGGLDNNGGSGNSGSGGGSGSGGSGPGGISVLPYTGGTLPILGIAGALLIGSGLLIRSLAR